MRSLYTDKIWDDFCRRTEANFRLKTYPQLDPFFDFPSTSHKIRDLVSDTSFEKIRSHNFLPFIKVLIKTPRYRYQEELGAFDLETKIRPISFAAHFDSYVYSFYSFALTDAYQKYIKAEGFQGCVLAYRNDLEGKSNIQFAKEAFDKVGESIARWGECSVIALDIKGYFDSIDHAILKEKWSKVVNEPALPDDQYKVFRSLTKYSYINYASLLRHFNINIKKVERKYKKENPGSGTRGWQSLLDLIPNSFSGSTMQDKMNLLRKRKLVCVNRDSKRNLCKKGIPQGSPMSAVLSNIYLVDFDKTMFSKGVVEEFTYLRYCDDILIICKPTAVNRLHKFLVDEISRKYKLEIQTRKTEVLDFGPDLRYRIRSFKRRFDEVSQEYLSLPNIDGNKRNLQYLGFEFNGESAYIRSSSLSRYFRKLKSRIVKTVSMAYSKNSKADVIFKQQLYSRYSQFGKRNFLTYARNASQEFYYNSSGMKKVGLNSPNIRRQVARHISILQKELLKTSQQRAEYKGRSKILI